MTIVKIIDEIKNNYVWVGIASILIFMGLWSAVCALPVSFSFQGTDVINKTTGNVLTIGDINVTVWDSSSGGIKIYEETFYSEVKNGSWNVMLGENATNPLNLNFQQVYYIDYEINGENFNFTNLTGDNVDRQFFYSSLGTAGYVNKTGDTMTGNLSIAPATGNALFTMNTAINQDCSINMTEGGLHGFTIGNDGSGLNNFFIKPVRTGVAYDAFMIDRDTSETTLYNNTWVKGLVKAGTQSFTSATGQATPTARFQADSVYDSNSNSVNKIVLYDNTAGSYTVGFGVSSFSGASGMDLFTGGTSGAFRFFTKTQNQAGTGATLQMVIDTDGDTEIYGDLNVTQNLTGNMIYGETYYKNYTGYTLDLITTEVYVNVTNMNLDSTNGFTASGDGLTTTISGVYLINSKVVLSANGEYGAMIHLSGTAQDECYALSAEAISSRQNMVINCIVSLTSGQVVTLAVDDHMNPVVDPTIYYANIVMTRIGN